MHGVLLNLQQPDLLKWCGAWPAWQLQLFPVRRFAGRLQSGSQETTEAKREPRRGFRLEGRRRLQERGEASQKSAGALTKGACKEESVPHRLDGEWAVPNPVCVRREEERCD